MNVTTKMSYYTCGNYGYFGTVVQINETTVHMLNKETGQ